MASGPPVWTLGGHTRNIFFTFFFGNGLRVLCSITLCLLSTTGSAFAGVVSALERLVEIQSRNPKIGQVRGMGLMIGVEFVKDQESKQPDEELRDRIIHLAFQSGLLLLGCGKSTIRIAPSLSINPSEIDQGLLIFEEAISQAEQQRIITHAA